MKQSTHPIFMLTLLSALLILGACNENKSENKTNEQHKEKATVSIDSSLLIGSWLDTSDSALHFSMLDDGTARSDNMQTLQYMKWRIDGKKLILTAKSIGNGSSSISDDIFEIETLTDKKMVLKNGEYRIEYMRKI